MASIKNLQMGLEILAKYTANLEDPFLICAEHDEILCQGPAPEECSKQDQHILENFHWHWSKTLDCWRFYT